MKKGVDYIGVGVGAVIINKNGEVFLSKRGEQAKNERGKWECPGGALEFGESFTDCIKREIMEEFGCEIEPMEMIEPVNHVITEEKQHWVALAYICKLKKGVPTILEPLKSSQIGWFSLSEMEKMNLCFPTHERLKNIKEKIKK